MQERFMNTEEIECECVLKGSGGVPEDEADGVLMGWNVAGLALSTNNYYMHILKSDYPK